MSTSYKAEALKFLFLSNNVIHKKYADTYMVVSEERAASSNAASPTIFDQRINTPAAYITNRHSSLRIDVCALPALPAMLAVYNRFWVCYRHIMNRAESAFCPVIDIAFGGWI